MTLNGLLGGQLQSLATNPGAFPATGTFPIVAFANQSVNAFAPNLRTPRVQSWSAGIQREMGKDTVLEVRYVANHATGLWRQDNLNEVNITHINLNDNTLEGMRHRRWPVFSVQYHPEASAGPHDSTYLFEEFCKMIEVTAEVYGPRD